MTRFQPILFCLVALAVSCTFSGKQSAVAGEQADGYPGSVASMLEQEAGGQQVDRRKLISNAGELDAATAWQAGLVQVDGQWVPVEDLDGSNALAEYVEKRRELELDKDPLLHLKLARWCARNKLSKQARAHYFSVLGRDPNHLEARQALGHSLVDGRWFNQQDVADAQQQATSTLQSLEKWTPKIQGIARLLSSRNAKSSVKALAKLDSIDDPGAIGALELFATNVDDDLARPMVGKLAGFRSEAACMALVRVALASPSLDIQQLATNSIRSYPEEMYVPELLDLLSSALTVDSQVVVHPTGNFALHTIIGRELRNEKFEKRFSKLASVLSRFSSAARARVVENQTQEHSTLNADTGNLISTRNESASLGVGAGGSSYSAIYVPREVADATAANLRTEATQRQHFADRKNQEIANSTHRACALLRSLTHEDLGDSPEQWWSWWNQRYERSDGEKPMTRYASVDRRNLEINTYRRAASGIGYVNDLGRVHTLQPTPTSCLVPGTQVQTAEGLRPVEEIRVGDLVLAQNIETGELDLKPVLVTTVGPPRETVKIATEHSDIQATGGHLWWVSGQGWLRARELKPGMHIRTATTSAKIESVDVVKATQRTHNLVVDEYHNYFVGEERLLSYDITFVIPTLRTVPGFGSLAGN